MGSGAGLVLGVRWSPSPGIVASHGVLDFDDLCATTSRPLTLDLLMGLGDLPEIAQDLCTVGLCNSQLRLTHRGRR